MLGGLQVLILLAADLEPGQVEALTTAAGVLDVHPPAAHVSPLGAETPFGGPADVHLARDDVGLGETGLLVGVGPVRAGREDFPAGLGATAPPEDDPLAAPGERVGGNTIPANACRGPVGAARGVVA